MKQTIITGDCRKLIKQIPDNSMDLIFTDPPYLKEYLSLYEWLANEAVKKVKPTGFLAMYVGCYHLADVIRLTKNLEYFMELVILSTGYGSMLWNRRVIGKHKSILLFRPPGGSGMPRCNITSTFTGTGADKRYHAWGQDEASARYYIDYLTEIDDTVLDPFLGGGTTAAMCKVLDRNCIAYEIDPIVADAARARVVSQPMPLHTKFISTPSFLE